MKNKVEFKKFMIKLLFIFLGMGLITLVLNIGAYHWYNRNYNDAINNIVVLLQEQYPNISEKEIIEVLNARDHKTSAILDKYGMNVADKAIIQPNDTYYHYFLLIDVVMFVLGLLVLYIMIRHFFKKREDSIQDVTKYLQELNHGNYHLKIDSNTEDELSILKNEIYKVTVMLREIADISQKDKLQLKTALEDISHQLKTPITSILIMLDNLIDDGDMDDVTREDFLRDIKRNITNINFLVQAMLKLSKFDANTINFVEKESSLVAIIEDAKKNIMPLCDLKNIKINVEGDKSIKVKCDFMWQVEALTNIIKNCVEHSPVNSQIEIGFKQNNAYQMITIRDYGSGIAQSELPHIFERFYKGKEAGLDSMGIGLALAKTIIEHDNGLIAVQSNEKGTCFTIKYFI